MFTILVLDLTRFNLLGPCPRAAPALGILVGVRCVKGGCTGNTAILAEVGCIVQNCCIHSILKLNPSLHLLCEHPIQVQVKHSQGRPVRLDSVAISIVPSYLSSRLPDGFPFQRPNRPRYCNRHKWGNVADFNDSSPA